VHGRLGFVINTGGEKVWVEDLESALARVPGVRDIAVTSTEDPEWGARVIALVVTDGEHIDDELREAALHAIGPWAKPKEIRYVAALPRTSNGKLRRGDLPHLQ
jgi:fatty-acyl-CoA synthase